MKYQLIEEYMQESFNEDYEALVECGEEMLEYCIREAFRYALFLESGL